MKKLDWINEHPAFASPQSLNVIKGLVAGAMGSSFIARTMPQFDVLGDVRVEAILRGEHEAMLARIRSQFLDDRVDFRANLFHLDIRCCMPEAGSSRGYTISACGNLKARAIVKHIGAQTK